MKEALFNIIFILLSMSFIHTSNQYIHNDFSTIYDSQYIVGASVYKENSNINKSLLLQLGLSNNICLNGVITPSNILDDIIINYNLGLIFFNDRNLIFNLNYIRSRFNESNLNMKEIDIGIKYKMISYNLNYFLCFDFIKGDIEKYILSFDVSKKLNKKYVIQFGSKFDLNKQSISPISFISLFYLL